MTIRDVLVPDLGGNKDVPVIDLLVTVGDRIEVDTPLVTLETDKATMDVPSPLAGTLVELTVRKDDRISAGSVIARIDVGAAAAPVKPAAGGRRATDHEASAAAPAPAPRASDEESLRTKVLLQLSGLPEELPVDRTTQLLVLGAGPGGYTAAYRAADLGLAVTLVERWPMLGGVCLNVGCIPSKALLHAAKVIEDAADMAAHGIEFGRPRIDLAKLRAWKQGVVKRLTNGLNVLAKQRRVDVVDGSGRFIHPHVLEVTRSDGSRERIRFEQCIVAAGSEPMTLPFVPADPRIMDSTGALELADIPQRMLVVGGGIIGLEMACVYAALGSKVSVVELTAQLMPGADPDLVRPLEKRLRARYERILTGAKVVGMTAEAGGIRVRFEGADARGEGADVRGEELYDRVLIAVGRVPNGARIGAEAAGLAVNERGYVTVDRQMRTSVPHIFAIGDIVGQPMLAHKATHEAKVAAEVAAGHKSAFDARVIPSVAYTDPEVAWVGLTEIDAKARGIPVKKGSFPWIASGRALSMAREEGFTKLLFDPDTRRLLGAGIIGPNAGELIAEAALAIEMGADAADIALTIHPHPTLSETVALSAEAFEGTLTDLYIPRKSQ
ncbi:MAG: Soluble pyridine nucleotide transhydrogenase [Steroidobacteraceae bacterium]|nr:Soluble pyridine nucleotide transhydrogenase [Steroidobacteraceae bacterium]